VASIVVLYYHFSESPLRGAVSDHLYSFQRYGAHETYYINLAVRSIPAFLLSRPVDLVIFHTTLLSFRWGGGLAGLLQKHGSTLEKLGGVKVAIPQDEFYRTDDLAAFINDLHIRHVFSVAPEPEWPKIYEKVDFEKVTFHKVLTGYLDDATVAHIDAMASTAVARTIDVGYRAWEARPWLGRHGMLKKTVAEAVAEQAPGRGLRCDLSLREQDTIYGDDWLRFLLRCRFTVGVEGGASLLDRDGSLRDRVDGYSLEHPEASFAEVEAACFPGRDGELKLFAISPRHLECCATRTGQVLVDGDYDGLLEAHRHYIPLRPDFSNLPEVLEAMKDEGRRRRMVDAAYVDVVKSDRFSYRRFVEFIVHSSRIAPAGTQVTASLRWRLGPVLDRLSYHWVALSVRARRAAKTLLPDWVQRSLRGRRRRHLEN
jgi:hypothetical protein